MREDRDKDTPRDTPKKGSKENDYEGLHGRRRDREGSNAVVYALLAVAIAVLVFNQITIANMGGTMRAMSGMVATDSNGAYASLSDVIPTGVPAVYGEELVVSYDDVSADNPARADATIRKLGQFDVDINLEGKQLERYISIVSRISCEYCCGAPSIIFTEDRGEYKAGDAACGCAHSYAMRGLAKYLITEHGDEFTDDRILEELGKWKTLFFPTQLTQKAGALQDSGIELNYINLASNEYRGIEQGSGGGMVGGC